MIRERDWKKFGIYIIVPLVVASVLIVMLALSYMSDAPPSPPMAEDPPAAVEANGIEAYEP